MLKSLTLVEGAAETLDALSLLVFGLASFGLMTTGVGGACSCVELSRGAPFCDGSLELLSAARGSRGNGGVRESGEGTTRLGDAGFKDSRSSLPRPGSET